MDKETYKAAKYSCTENKNLLWTICLMDQGWLLCLKEHLPSPVAESKIQKTEASTGSHLFGNGKI